MPSARDVLTIWPSSCHPITSVARFYQKDFYLMIQTWLPLPSFKDSAEALSDTDLSKQVADALRVIEHLHQIPMSETKLADQYWKMEPLVPISPANMWQGCEMQLCEYAIEMAEEASIRQGQKNQYMDALHEHLDWSTGEDSYMGKPSWFGNLEFHLSHQAALVRKDPEFYGKIFSADDSLMLMWPTHATR